VNCLRLGRTFRLLNALYLSGFDRFRDRTAIKRFLAAFGQVIL
jgi:hypothetical protein